MTIKQLHKLTRHWQNKLHLRDWQIHLNIGTQPSKEMKLWMAEGEDIPAYRYSGLTYVLADRQMAFIWIPLESLKEDGDDPKEVLLHEMLHILHAAYPDNEELKVRILSDVILST